MEQFIEHIKKLFDTGNAISSSILMVLAVSFNGGEQVLGYLFASIFVLLVVDLLTGIAKNIKAYMQSAGLSMGWTLCPPAWIVLLYLALKPGFVETAKMVGGIWKFAGYMLFMLLAIAVDHAIDSINLQKFIPGGLPDDLPVLYVFTYLALREVKSILENLGACGLSAADTFYNVLCAIEDWAKAKITSKIK